MLNNASVSQPSSQKHLSVIFDTKLGFDGHLKMAPLKINKTLGFFEKLQNPFWRSVQIAIHKAFFRRHLDYGDVLYDKVYNMFFNPKLETI